MNEGPNGNIKLKMATFAAIQKITPRLVFEYGEPLFEHQRKSYVLEDTIGVQSGISLTFHFGCIVMVVIDLSSVNECMNDALKDFYKSTREWRHTFCYCVGSNTDFIQFKLLCRNDMPNMFVSPEMFLLPVGLGELWRQRQPCRVVLDEYGAPSGGTFVGSLGKGAPARSQKNMPKHDYKTNIITAIPISELAKACRRNTETVDEITNNDETKQAWKPNWNRKRKKESHTYTPQSAFMHNWLTKSGKNDTPLPRDRVNTKICHKKTTEKITTALMKSVQETHWECDEDSDDSDVDHIICPRRTSRKKNNTPVLHDSDSDSK